MNKTEQWNTLKELVIHNRGIIHTKKEDLLIDNVNEITKASYEGAEQALNNIINAMTELEKKGVNEYGF